MNASYPEVSSLTELLAAALRAESAALVANDPARLAAAHAHRRHLNLLLGAESRLAAAPLRRVDDGDAR